MSKPTTKQVNYLLTLIGGKWEADAYKYASKVTGKSAMHRDRFTSSDFSRAINAAKKAS